MKVFETKIGLKEYTFYRITIPKKYIKLFNISPKKEYDWGISPNGNLELMEITPKENSKLAEAI